MYMVFMYCMTINNNILEDFMNKEFLDAMNEQMNFEFESAFIYKAMSAYLARLDLDGMVHFMDMQVEEEIIHGDDFKVFLQDLGYDVKYRALDPGEGEYKDVVDVFKSALEHEKLVTANINRLYDEAREINDRRAEIFLQTYIQEQIEEEDTFTKLVTKLERIDGNWHGLYMLDAELGTRPQPTPMNPEE